jgi:SAM-dependent methyltransferase
MTNNYDPIAEQYKRSKLQPWRTYIECFTLMKLIGDPRGLTVLDVGCGEGFYTRMIRERGAARATGIDLSHRMIELACTASRRTLAGRAGWLRSVFLVVLPGSSTHRVHRVREVRVRAALDAVPVPGPESPC